MKPNLEPIFADSGPAEAAGSWPFWDSNVKTEGDWKDTCRICPGSGEGDLIPGIPGLGWPSSGC